MSKVAKWLHPPERSAPESFARCQGTNEWLLESEKFQDWVKTPSSAFHLHGPGEKILAGYQFLLIQILVGCGKTVLRYASQGCL